MATATMSRRGSGARRRLLDTATALFYAEGLHAVGIDRIIAEAGVAKATFYHHFGSKDELICAYLAEVHDQQVDAVEAVFADATRGSETPNGAETPNGSETTRGAETTREAETAAEAVPVSGAAPVAGAAPAFGEAPVRGEAPEFGEAPAVGAASALGGGVDAATARVHAFFGALVEIACAPGFRGCAFVNAAAEYPETGHPVRRVVDDHRRWLIGLFRDQLEEAGHPGPEATARLLVVLRDGLLVTADLDDAAALADLAHDAVTRILAGGRRRPRPRPRPS